MAVEGPSADLEALDEALTKLVDEDSAKADLAKMFYFAGLKLGQAAEMLGISHVTAE